MRFVELKQKPFVWVPFFAGLCSTEKDAGSFVVWLTLDIVFIHTRAFAVLLWQAEQFLLLIDRNPMFGPRGSPRKLDVCASKNPHRGSLWKLRGLRPYCDLLSF